jgi:catechol 2,3-dioxygenase
MTVTTTAIFGADATIAVATPGSYGRAPARYRLPQSTSLGHVRLQISDLSRSIAFYEQTLGLQVVERTASHATLSAHGHHRVMIELIAGHNVRPAESSVFGLYHVAILLPDRASLGAFAQHLMRQQIPAGAGDHLVSEALYLRDPDGLGIEVYADRSRDRWQRVGRELMIATDPLDLRGLIAAAEGAPWRGMPSGTVIGHVHLQIGDLAEGARFFSDALGFDCTTWRYPGALFLGAGGYHHHLGTNVWAADGARVAGAQDAQLLEWTIEVPTSADVSDVAASLAAAAYDIVRQSNDDLVVRDPWGCAVRVCVAGTQVGTP